MPSYKPHPLVGGVIDRLFKQVPGLLFEFVDVLIDNTIEYRFDSVEVKETAFRIDGVFLPPDHANPKIVFFAEVQFQKDEDLYHRFFSELFVFLYRHQVRYDNWQGILMFGSRSYEPTNFDIHQALLNSAQVQRIYLDELGDLRSQPITVGLMLLTLSSEQNAPDDARFLLTQAQQKPDPTLPAKVIIDLVTTIMLYKFGTLNREEVEAMLSLNLQETRVYQDAKAEGREEGKVEGREEGRVEGRVEGKLEGKLEGREEGKLEGKLELVPQCLERGMSIPETATFLGVSVDQVEAEISKTRLEQN